MFKKVTFTLILVVLLFTTVGAEDFLSPLEAEEVAQELIQRNVAYYLAHPERAGNIPEWRHAALSDWSERCKQEMAMVQPRGIG